jgi:metallo-beta-lactamase class B
MSRLFRFASTVAFGSLVVTILGAQERPVVEADKPIACGSCDTWNAERAPFRVFANTYFVGVKGLSSILVTSDQGHILLDGGLPQSAAIIDRHIRSLGFRTEDIRLIATSHEHFDHVGGVAALQRASRAAVAASATAARALQSGGPTADDPQYGYGRASTAFPSVTGVRTVRDGETLRVGPLAVTAHLTPGHTPGSTTWTWQSCEGARCLNLVYADSLNAVSAPGFKFSTHPERVSAFRSSIEKVRALPCDILLSVHPEFSGLDRKLARRTVTPSTNPFVDPDACRTYAGNASRTLEQRITDER